MSMRSFEQAVEGIRNAERDVDRVLEAARLSRNEESRNERVGIVLLAIVGLAIIAAGMAPAIIMAFR